MNNRYQHLHVRKGISHLRMYLVTSSASADENVLVSYTNRNTPIIV
jgi:hypothetical protein